VACSSQDKAGHAQYCLSCAKRTKHCFFLGFNLTSILSFNSDEDAVFFVTQDPIHTEMVAAVEKDLIKTPIVSIFKDLDTTFHAPIAVGDDMWTGHWE
jgi:hypothetical protein